jgi:7-carboxy-7-deazaguanine synthase
MQRQLFPVNEIFETLQGEGFHVGTPSVFLRLQGCDVGCAWCDTKHSWPSDDRNLMSAGDLLDECLKYRSRHVVLTGGEPCQFDLTDLTESLLDHGFTVQIETSGTYPVRVSPGVWVTVSPKVGMKRQVRTEAVKRANEIKHPVGKPQDIDNLRAILHHANTNIIWLQPLSQSQKATGLCCLAAIENGWRVSFQVHKYAGLR